MIRGHLDKSMQNGLVDRSSECVAILSVINSELIFEQQMALYSSFIHTLKH